MTTSTTANYSKAYKLALADDLCVYSVTFTNRGSRNHSRHHGREVAKRERDIARAAGRAAKLACVVYVAREDIAS
jgi:hypothetical protein